jgi:very-short-patch-repair endonuclease
MLRGTGASIGAARKLRRSMTLPEVLLWRELRSRPGGFKFRRQHPAGPFILDFVCLSARLAIEIDGEAHDRGGSPARDEARDEWLMAQGYRTLRIPAREILHNLDGALGYVLAQCQGGKPARDEWLMAQGYRTLRIPAREILHDLDGALGYILAECQPLHPPPAAGGPPPRSGEDC